LYFLSFFGTVNTASINPEPHQRAAETHMDTHGNKHQLSASLEDYIEAIYHIIAAKEVARGKDISKRLQVSGASVTEALRALSKKGLINYAPYEVITMTSRGQLIAEDVIRRHNSLKKFFTEVLAVDDAIAEQGACKFEHTAPPEIIEQMVNFSKFLDVCPRGGSELLQGFADFCKKGKTRVNCDECISQCLEHLPFQND
jgi:DtxR family Mn-dependent transcriptional regulator